MGDVNELKFINDSFEHSISDKLLKKVAKIMELDVSFSCYRLSNSPNTIVF